MEEFVEMALIAAVIVVAPTVILTVSPTWKPVVLPRLTTLELFVTAAPLYCGSLTLAAVPVVPDQLFWSVMDVSAVKLRIVDVSVVVPSRTAVTGVRGRFALAISCAGLEPVCTARRRQEVEQLLSTLAR